MQKLDDDFLRKIYALMNGNPAGVMLGGDGGDGSFQMAGSTPTYYGSGDMANWNVNQYGVANDTGDGYTNNYNPDGTFRDRTANTGGNYYAKQLGKAAATAAAMYGGANFLNGMFPGADAAMGAGVEAAGGGAGLDAVGAAAGSGNGLTMAQMEALLGTPGYGATTAQAGFNAALNGAGAGAVFNAPSVASGGFLDKVGGFLSDPKNLLQTVGTIGALVEGNKKGNDSTTTTKTFDPAVREALFGTGGLIGKANDYVNKAAANNYSNPQMDLAKAKMTGLLSDPRVWESLYSIGGTGVSMTKNPWLLKGG